MQNWLPSGSAKTTQPVPGPYFPRWSSTSGYLGAVQAPAAWDRQVGDPTVTIAVVDSTISS